MAQGSRNRAQQASARRGRTAQGSRTTKAERRAAAEARLREEHRRERRRRMTFAIVAIVVVLAAGGGLTALALTRHSGTSSSASSGAQIVPTTPTGTVTVQQKTNQVPDKSGISGVLAWDTGDWPGAGTSTAAGILEHQHVGGPVTYSITPPVGGPHSDVWMNAGVYTKPIPPERAVHNLEHGAVWITYRPDLPAAQVDALRKFVDKQSLIDESAATRIAGQKSRYVDMSPWSSNDLPSPIVISAWGHQLRVSSPTDSRLQKFVDTFRNSQKYSPEFGSAVDGVPVQTGGRPAADGATAANPSGSGLPSAGG